MLCTKRTIDVIALLKSHFIDVIALLNVAFHRASYHCTVLRRFMRHCQA